MSSSSTLRIRGIFCLGLVCLATMFAGCGLERIQLPQEDSLGTLTLEELEDIQDDERLTDDQKREAIRDATGAPNDADGDRLVEFLLNFNVP